jgi:NitT/TauT family transport system substrate-binding protein
MKYQLHIKTIGLTMMLLAMTPTALKAEKFVFTTSWTAQAEFAGYYIAKEKGFYREQGLDVVIQHPSLTSTTFHRLQSDQCDAAMISMMSAMDFIAQGIPLVNIFQDSMNSSNIIVSRWDTEPLKMKGKKVAIFNSDPSYLAIIMSKKEGMDYEWVRFTSHINLFLSGAIDATMAVSYNEYYQLMQAGFKMSEDNIYRFSEHGFNIQENGVYVKRDYFLTHREACQKFATATRKGWEWVAAHPDEALEIVMKYVRKYNAPTNRVMQKLMLKECLRLQLDPDSKRREFRVRPDMVEKASRLMLECGMLKRRVTYKELMGQ